MTAYSPQRHRTLWPRNFWLAILGLATLGCGGPIAPLLTNEQPFETRHDYHGIQFNTTTTRPISFTPAPRSKIGLVHEDRDEADRLVRVALEQAIFSLKAAIPSLIVVERRSVGDLEKEFRFQASGMVKDEDLAKIGHFLGLDYVVVFDPIYHDLNELYGLRNQIDTWEVALPVKIVAVNTAEVKLYCLATVKANLGKMMTASEVRILNQEALGIAVTLTRQCLTDSLTDTASHS